MQKKKKKIVHTNFRQINVSINKFGKQEWACILLYCQGLSGMQQ
jgi:hypothetical protein